MKIMIDTNIMISAVLNMNSTPGQAYLRACINHKPIVCQQNIRELYRIFNRKFSNKLDLLEKFMGFSVFYLKVVSIPEEIAEEEKLIRDVDDRAILRAAIAEKADILLTGDKDFLESGITNPRIMTAAEFLKW